MLCDDDDNDLSDSTILISRPPPPSVDTSYASYASQTSLRLDKFIINWFDPIKVSLGQVFTIGSVRIVIKKARLTSLSVQLSSNWKGIWCFYHETTFDIKVNFPKFCWVNTRQRVAPGRQQDQHLDKL